MNQVIILAAAIITFIASTASAAGIGTKIQENIGVGKVLNIGLNNNSPRAWSLYSNSNAHIAKSTLTVSSLEIRGLMAGTTSITACNNVTGECIEVAVTVSGNQVLGESILAPHPVGTFVLHQGTAYYVHANGLIPITTERIFFNNGGNWKTTLTATEADLSLPLLPLMTLNDIRVK